jgi:hypothetical protein
MSNFFVFLKEYRRNTTTLNENCVDRGVNSCHQHIFMEVSGQHVCASYSLYWQLQTAF